MDNKFSLHEGELLRVLIKRAGLKVEDVAQKLDMLPNSLSRLFKSKKIKPIKKRIAADLLGVDISVFETGLAGYAQGSNDGVLEELGSEYAALAAKLESIEAENARLAEDLMKEKAVSEELRALLKEIVTMGKK